MSSINLVVIKYTFSTGRRPWYWNSATAGTMHRTLKLWWRRLYGIVEPKQSLTSEILERFTEEGIVYLETVTEKETRAFGRSSLDEYL